MFNRRVLLSMLVIVVVWVVAAPAADEQNLILLDGSSLLVESAVVRDGVVIVKFSNGRMQQYEAADVNLAASGLLAEEAPDATNDSADAGLTSGFFGSAIAPASESAAVVSITDDDVAHIRHDRVTEVEEEAAEGDEAEQVIDGDGALRITNVNRVVSDDQVTVTGQVVNDGVVDLSGVVIAARAEDIEGENLGEGTVGISKTLQPGAAHSFSLVISVDGEATNVVLSGQATVMRETAAPESEESAASEGEDQAEDGA